jgi:ABC-type Fe3+/spermidine/putrescine transport system ATPase subunit
MLADRIALMLAGRIHQDGLARDFYEKPASEAVARFFGTKNFVRGTVTGQVFESPLGRLTLRDDHPRGEGVLVIRQEAIEAGDGENPIDVTIERAMYLGTHVRVWAQAQGITLQFTAPPGIVYESGQSVRLHLPAARTWVVPVEGSLS